MTRVIGLFLITVFLISSLRVSAATPTVPGLQPTAATLDQVLQLYLQEDEQTRINAYSETWTETADGLNGIETIVHDRGNYVETDQLGPFVTSFGRDKAQSWYQNENGYTVLVHDTRASSQQTDEAFRVAINKHMTSDIHLLGEVVTPVRAYVIDIDPPTGPDTWVFIAAATGDVVRKDTFSAHGQYTQIFDDYRTEHGVRLPWHIHSSDGFSPNDNDQRMTSFEPGVRSDPHAFDIPYDRRVVVKFPAGQSIVRLPATITDDHVVVLHASINGRGVDFILDSGGSGIYIDDQVAQKLGLTMYGAKKETLSAAYTSHRTLIPELHVGNLTLHNIAANELPLAEDIDANTQAVGLLGFDFIADMVLHIDYYNKKVEAIQAQAFTPPAGAMALNIDLNDEVPSVAGSIGGVTGAHFIIDTGGGDTMIFKGFALAHPDAVHDLGLGRQIRMLNSFDMEFEGVGNGFFKAQPAVVMNFQVGPMNFNKWLLVIGDNPPEYETTKNIGLVGQDFLYLFDAYFYYANSLIYLVPNNDFHKSFR